MHPFARIPIRVRLTLWQVTVFSLIVAALGVLLVVNERSTLQTTARESLEQTARVVVDRLVDQGSDLTTILQQTTIPGESGTQEVVGQIIDTHRTVVESSGQPAVVTAMVTADMLETASSAGHWHGPVRLPGRPHEDMMIVLRLDQGAHTGSFLVLAQTLAAVERTVNRLRDLLLAVTPAALLLAAVGGWLVAGAALRPVDSMTRRAAAIQGSAPHETLPVPPARDELARLAATLNGMLDRLRRSIDAERRFSADASHELRTPIGVMEAELDVALRSRTMPPQARDVLSSVREEVTALGRIVANLLLLSRAEAAGAVEIARRDTDLHELAANVVDRFRTLAVERDIELTLDGDAVPAAVDADLLQQAVANLVDNALGYTDAGGTVRVHTADGTLARISVTDTGRGIAADELPRIFDRFYRVDRARRRGGSGLGLEISRRIVEAHGGSIDATSEVGRGSTFTITLPLS